MDAPPPIEKVRRGQHGVVGATTEGPLTNHEEGQARSLAEWLQEAANTLLQHISMHRAALGEGYRNTVATATYSNRGTVTTSLHQDYVVHYRIADRALLLVVNYYESVDGYSATAVHDSRSVTIYF